MCECVTATTEAVFFMLSVSAKGFPIPSSQVLTTSCIFSVVYFISIPTTETVTLCMPLVQGLCVFIVSRAFGVWCTSYKFKAFQYSRRGIMELPIYRIWHGNSLLKYNPQKGTVGDHGYVCALQSVTMRTHTHVRAWILQQMISYCTATSCLAPATYVWQSHL